MIPDWKKTNIAYKLFLRASSKHAQKFHFMETP